MSTEMEKLREENARLRNENEALKRMVDARGASPKTPPTALATPDWHQLLNMVIEETRPTICGHLDEKHHRDVVMAKAIVAAWESIPARADEFQRRYDCSGHAREGLMRMLRTAAGGEEVYRAAREFLDALPPSLR